MLAPDVEDLITRALAEDVGSGDLTTEAVVEARPPRRRPGRPGGTGVPYWTGGRETVFRRLDPGGRIDWRPVRPEGEWMAETPATLAELQGSARALLTGERVSRAQLPPAPSPASQRRPRPP